MRVLGEGTAHDSAENVSRRRESPRRRRRAVGKSQARYRMHLRDRRCSRQRAMGDETCFGLKRLAAFFFFFFWCGQNMFFVFLPPSLERESSSLGGSCSLQACKWRSQVGKHLANHKAQGSIPASVSLAVAPLPYSLSPSLSL